MHHVQSRARQAAWRTDSSDSKYSRCIPYGRNNGSISSSGGTALRGNTNQSVDSTKEVSRELPEEDQEAGRRANATYQPEEPVFISPQPTRNQTDYTETSDSTQVDSPIEKAQNINGNGSNQEYYQQPQSLEQREVSNNKKAPLWRRALGKDKKNDSGDVERTTTSESKTKKHYGLVEQLKVVLLGSWINVLLICVPIGIALHAAEVNPYASFAVNFIAIIPLAGILSFATEELSLRVGETLGGLLNASFGNAVELIVSVIALFQDQIIIVQTSLIGSILSNLLLVLGMCFFFGGFKRIEQFFNTTVAQTSSSLLSLAVGTLIIPTTFKRFGTGGTAEARQAQIPRLSRGLAVMLLLVYLAYLFFQLKTHSTMFTETGGQGTKRPERAHEEKSAVRKKFSNAIGHNNAAHAGGPPDDIIKGEEEQTEEEEAEEPRLSVIGAILTLCISTAFVGVTSEFMVDGIQPLSNYISPEFIGLIMIPIVGNAAEHVTAVTVAIKDKMDLAIGVAVGSSMQIALFVLPLIVIIGWFADKDAMGLEFDGFLLVVVFVSVLLVNYLIGDGRSHWLEGVMLLALYIIIAVAAFLYPADQDALTG